MVRIIGITLIIFSIILTAFTTIKDEFKKRENIKIEKNFQKKITSINETKNNVSNMVDNECLSCDIEKKEDENINKEDNKAVDRNIIGVIRIDKLDVVLPIHSDASQDSLLEGAGIVDTTDFPSVEKNTLTVLAGHRGGRNRNQSFFNIDKLESGDTIKITLNNLILNYEVTGEKVIDPYDWSEFTRSKDKTKLYLMSCHPYPLNNKRLIIKAELIDFNDVNN